MRFFFVVLALALALASSNSRECASIYGTCASSVQLCQGQLLPGHGCAASCCVPYAVDNNDFDGDEIVEDVDAAESLNESELDQVVNGKSKSKTKILIGEEQSPVTEISCSNTGGDCINTVHASCSQGTIVPGKCAAQSDSIKCCVGATRADIIASKAGANEDAIPNEPEDDEALVPDPVVAWPTKVAKSAGKCISGVFEGVMWSVKGWMDLIKMAGKGAWQLIRHPWATTKKVGKAIGRGASRAWNWLTGKSKAAWKFAVDNKCHALIGLKCLRAIGDKLKRAAVATKMAAQKIWTWLVTTYKKQFGDLPYDEKSRVVCKVATIVAVELWAIPNFFRFMWLAIARGTGKLANLLVKVFPKMRRSAIVQRAKTFAARAEYARKARVAKKLDKKALKASKGTNVEKAAKARTVADDAANRALRAADDLERAYVNSMMSNLGRSMKGASLAELKQARVALRNVLDDAVAKKVILADKAAMKSYLRSNAQTLWATHGQTTASKKAVAIVLKKHGGMSNKQIMKLVRGSGSQKTSVFAKLSLSAARYVSNMRQKFAILANKPGQKRWYDFVKKRFTTQSKVYAKCKLCKSYYWDRRMMLGGQWRSVKTGQVVSEEVVVQYVKNNHKLYKLSAQATEKAAAAWRVLVKPVKFIGKVAVAPFKLVAKATGKVYMVLKKTVISGKNWIKNSKAVKWLRTKSQYDARVARKALKKAQSELAVAESRLKAVVAGGKPSRARRVAVYEAEKRVKFAKSRVATTDDVANQVKRCSSTVVKRELNMISSNACTLDRVSIDSPHVASIQHEVVIKELRDQRILFEDFMAKHWDEITKDGTLKANLRITNSYSDKLMFQSTNNVMHQKYNQLMAQLENCRGICSADSEVWKTLQRQSADMSGEYKAYMKTLEKKFPEEWAEYKALWDKNGGITLKTKGNVDDFLPEQMKLNKKAKQTYGLEDTTIGKLKAPGAQASVDDLAVWWDKVDDLARDQSKTFKQNYETLRHQIESYRNAVTHGRKTGQKDVLKALDNADEFLDEVARLSKEQFYAMQITEEFSTKSWKAAVTNAEMTGRSSVRAQQTMIGRLQYQERMNDLIQKFYSEKNGFVDMFAKYFDEGAKAKDIATKLNKLVDNHYVPRIDDINAFSVSPSTADIKYLNQNYLLSEAGFIDAQTVAARSAYRSSQTSYSGYSSYAGSSEAYARGIGVIPGYRG